MDRAGAGWQVAGGVGCGSLPETRRREEPHSVFCLPKFGPATCHHGAIMLYMRRLAEQCQRACTHGLFDPIKVKELGSTPFVFCEALLPAWFESFERPDVVHLLRCS